MLRLFAALIVVLGPWMADATAQDRRVALVIGNGKYQHAGTLTNPANDARAVARSLTEIGFEVVQGVDLDRAGMEGRIREFLAKAAKAKIALLFYAGHGLQVEGRNYLIPVDARLDSASDLNFGTVELDKVLASLEDPSRASIIILDACRDNPLARSFATRVRSAAVGSGLAAYTSLGVGSLIAFSTAPGKVAVDGTGANSPFTESLVKHLRTPGLEVRQMLTRVRNDVAAATADRQIPWDNSSLRGDIYLAGLAPAAPVKPAQSQSADPCAAASEHWRSAEAIGTRAALEDHVARFGNCSYIGLARARLESLQKIAVVAPPSQPPVAPTSPKPAVGTFNDTPGPAPLSAEQERALKPRDSFRECPACPEMIVVPAGSFLMGTAIDDPDRLNDEIPQTRIGFARPFAAGRFEVSFAEWDACVADGGCDGYRPPDVRADGASATLMQSFGWGWGRGKNPVMNVTWDHAKSYVAWLSRKTGKTYRLLSESEWEYIARAGTTTAYWFGASVSPAQANGGEGGHKKPLPVDSYLPNGWGFYNVHGNVAEWVEDCLNSDNAKRSSPADGSPYQPALCRARGVRGGSYYLGTDVMRSAARRWLDPGAKYSTVGFRVARTLAAP